MSISIPKEKLEQVIESLRGDNMISFDIAIKYLEYLLEEGTED